jgi:hypothetical protein
MSASTLESAGRPSVAVCSLEDGGAKSRIEVRPARKSAVRPAKGCPSARPLVLSIRAPFFKKDEAMLWNASALNGYPIQATDGTLGTVADLLYDESDWAIRWLVVDTGEWLSGRRVLLPVAVLGQPDPQSFHLPVNLTMRQVEESPDVDDSEPPSKGIGTRIREHYEILRGEDHFLWGGDDGHPPDVIPPDQPPQSATASPAELQGARRDVIVRGISEIAGDLIEATDGDIGHAEDFLVDTALWQVRYLIVHTSSWWPGEKLLVSPLSINSIDWAQSVIHLDVSRQKVRSGPSYVATEAIDGAFEELFHTYYGIR